MIDYVNVVLTDMPCTIVSFVRENEDCGYTVMINSRIDKESQRAAFYHEMSHIENGDCDSNEGADLIEIATHNHKTEGEDNGI